MSTMMFANVTRPSALTSRLAALGLAITMAVPSLVLVATVTAQQTTSTICDAHVEAMPTHDDVHVQSCGIKQRI